MFKIDVVLTFIMAVIYFNIYIAYVGQPVSILDYAICYVMYVVTNFIHSFIISVMVSTR